MIASMTGFGRAEGVFENKKISIDLRAVNSKSLDVNLRWPSVYKEKEFTLKKILSERVIRGKVDVYFNVENLVQESQITLNTSVLQDYMAQLKAVSGTETPEYELLKIAMKLPDSTTAKTEAITEEEWAFIEQLLNEAITRLIEFREAEGASLHQELQNNLNHIRQYLAEVAPYERERMVAIKEKYQKTLQEFEAIDETRFYQEMAYYTEKLDIAEEKVRLSQHLNYYEEVMQNETCNGKKLGFIAQEIGREINTLGSKANHAQIQKLVVLMKDDLEKIKEQTLNVL
ncbi:YicC/YloC family endoribonuclease [Riemerella columbina]|uniref:YicC/YloC family endoribonuclease n=1 Tax=Riemerella columbina TaxID=103810 RepID=UPI00266F0EF1|nr:YicC/YloC family endoribonuclease [Riemerella columbina]WKS94903.1 YicC family protein [Riemerella columbina]